MTRFYTQHRMVNFSTAAQERLPRDLSSIVPDYKINEADHADIKRVDLSHQQILAKHPSEYATPDLRKNLDYASKIQKNEFLLFNLPNSITEHQIKEICSAKGVQVLKTTLTKSLDDSKFAFAFVKVGSPTQVKTVKDKFRNFWLEDRKIKMKSSDELSYEIYDHRTIIVQNLPCNYVNKDLVELFSAFGAVVGIEMPTKNVGIENELKDKLDSFVVEKREKFDLETKRAQKLVQDSILDNEAYFRSVLTNSLGQEESERIMLSYVPKGDQKNLSPQKKFNDILDGQRQYSIQSMLAQLQLENTQVGKARTVLKQLKHQVSQDTPSLGQSVQESIQANKDMIKGAISYVSNNREAIDEASLTKLNETIISQATGQSIDPIQKLQDLSRSQLAYAYDALLDCLSQRQQLIEKRIKDQIHHLGKEERILFDEKDWSRELEDLKVYDDPLNSDFRTEEILSASEQVQNVLDFKYQSPEERLFHIVTKTFNPFQQANFDQKQIELAVNDDLNTSRIPTDAPNPSAPPSINRALFKGYTYTDDNLELIKAQIEDMRDKFDLPFDELYHKEKKLVDAVIKATLALRQKESTLPNPMGADRTYDAKTLKGEYYGEEFQSEHQFVRDQRRKNEKILDESIDNRGSSQFDFKINEVQNNAHELLDQGIISQKEFDMLVSMQREAQNINMGYAFVTFSHSDEAKLALIIAQGMNADNLELDLTIKTANVDHKDFDFRYKMNKLRNESKLSEELKDLRESREELRKFEQNIDQDLPSLKKIKEFKELARETIDNGERPFSASGINRSPHEEENLNQKIRDLQKQNPDVDYTQLFDTERAEIARKAQHKKAFASYKAFQFLKNGVELESRGAAKSQKKQSQPSPYQSADPYDFPQVTETVNKIMTKDRKIRVLDSGDALDQKPGRKFGYTEQDFMEAYFGKDFARNASLEYTSGNVFGYNESYKKTFPIDKYLKMPQVEADRRRFQERADIFALDSESRDQGFQDFVRNLDVDNEETFKDTPHPTDKGRSLVKDTQMRLENYFERKEKQTDGLGIWSTKEVAGIRRTLLDEYFPKPKKEKVQEDDEADTKIEEKFEPFYEGEANNKQESSSSSSTDDEATTTGTSTTKSEEQPASTSHKSQDRKHGKPQQSSQGSSTNTSSTRHQRQQQNPADKYKQSPLYAGTQQDELNSESPLTQEERDENRNFIYDYKFRQRQSERKEKQDQEGVKTQRLQKYAEFNNMSAEELFDQVKELANIAENTQNGGKFTLKDRIKGIKGDQDVSGRSQKVKSLSEFAGKSANEDDADLSEREEEDIYHHYIEQMKKAKLEDAKQDRSKVSQEEKLVQEKIKELQGIAPDVPNFEGFFRSQSQGKHPFEEDQFSNSPKQDQKDLAEQEEFDQELLQRELQGRLMGEETLTPRQFKELYKAKVDESSQVKYMKDSERKQFIDNRDLVRILDEQKEAARRRMIQGKLWTEEESHQKMSESIAEASKDAPSYLDDHQTQRNFKELKELLFSIQNPQRLFEKEYHFDEGLGQSLKDHVEEIKKKFPGLQVLVRRDRDGYPIVKTQFKPKYKYSLENLEKFNAENQEKLMKESLDDLLKTVIGGDSLQSLDKQQLENKIRMLSIESQQSDFEFDEKTKQAISALWEERVHGRFQNDRDGFTKALFEINESAGFDESKKKGSSFLNPGPTSESIISQMFEERDLMAQELTEQLSLRIKEHMHLKERKSSDFVKSRMSETNIFGSQIQNQSNSINLLEKDAAVIEQKQGEEGFDKEAYQQLKNEIKKRHEAKQRLLQQGFPELKSYIQV